VIEEANPSALPPRIAGQDAPQFFPNPGFSTVCGGHRKCWFCLGKKRMPTPRPRVHRGRLTKVKGPRLPPPARSAQPVSTDRQLVVAGIGRTGKNIDLTGVLSESWGHRTVSQISR